MELTRRDAVLALAGGGVAVGAKAVAEGAAGDTAAGGAASLSDTDLETLVAAAEVLYPTSVGASREFVEAYATRRFADRAYPDPAGTAPQRIRYYVLNGLLYALYASPRGAELVGSTNPEGYPGGQEAYQRRPDR